MTKHSKDKREDAQRRFREQLKQHADQYLAEYDKDDESDVEHAIEGLTVNATDNMDQFFTSFGPISTKGAKALTSTLANNTFDHALTGTAPQNVNWEKPVNTEGLTVEADFSECQFYDNNK